MVKFKLSILCFLIIFTAVSLIHPEYPQEQFLQHIGTFFLVLILIYDIRKNVFSKTAYLGVVTFTFIHIIGARYIYSYVPYNDWFKFFLDFDFQNYFGFKRNHFDRFVHFSFGFLFFPSIVDFLRKKNINSLLFIFCFAWLSIQTFSLIYELFEWSLSIYMSPEDAENYNGQQGDLWDAQKDMALALLGSSLSFILYFIKLKSIKNA